MRGEDPWDTPQWKTRLQETHFGNLAPAAPVLLGHGRQDQVLPLEQAHTLRQRRTRLGADVRLHEVRSGEHLTAARL
ncbi:lipase family protein [Nocardia wallacei]|uniref:lipase family protein n=1 Tax=Nocardia wallacei TaxID=480035 RepID=UPI0024543657|nr:lipase family protein [Nocardia wallacei]